MTDEHQEAHDFWLEVGRTLDAWQRVEQAMCEIFVTTVQAPIGDVVRAAFYKVNSVGTKRSMVSAALSIRVANAELLARWKKLSEQIEKHSKSRNSLAHGTRWDHQGHSFMGPHFNDVALRDRHMQTDDNILLDAAAIHRLQIGYWELSSELAQYNNDVGIHTMSFGKLINMPEGRI